MIGKINWIKGSIRRSKIKIRNAAFCHATISILTCDLATSLPNSTYIPHPYGIVIGHDVEIGEKCTIRQGVTIGAVVQREGYPKIGDNVDIGANSTIIGNINIGSNSIIGAGSVVVKDIPENCVAVGVPAKVIKRNRMGTM